MINNILIAVPTYESISTETYESLWHVHGNSGANVEFTAIKGYDCARARNEAVKKFLKKDYDYLMMVDSDIILPDEFKTNPNYIDYLITVTDIYDVILGWYPRKNEPTKTEIFMLGYNGYPAASRWNCSELRRWPKEIIKIKGGGFGCAFIPRYVFDRVDFPYFKYDLRDDNTYISEDLYFCNKVRDAGFRICTVKTLACDHVGKKIVKACDLNR